MAIAAAATTKIYKVKPQTTKKIMNSLKKTQKISTRPGMQSQRNSKARLI